MKHASANALSALQALLATIRLHSGLVEKRPGIFYRNGAAFLHFHEDPAGLFADIKLDGARFSRFPVNTPAEQQALLTQLKSVLAPAAR